MKIPYVINWVEVKVYHKERNKLKYIKKIVSKSKHWSNVLDKMPNAEMLIILDYQFLVLDVEKLNLKLQY